MTITTEVLIFPFHVDESRRKASISTQNNSCFAVFWIYRFLMDFPFDVDDARRTEWREQVLA